MALNRTQASTPASSAATAFEEQDGDTTTTVEASGATTEGAAEPAPEVRASASRAVAAAASRALASPLSAMTTVMDTLKDVIPTDQLASMGIGVFPRITVGLDGFSIDKTKELGKAIKVAVLSWNYVWLVTTGEQNNAEANKLIRTSYDGINLKDGAGTVAEYLAELKAQEYDKASSKQYAEIYAMLTWSKEKGDVPDEEQTIHQISVSPQSVGKWGAYNLETKVRKMKGVADSNVVMLTQEKKVLGPNSFGIITFSVPK